MSNFYGKYPPTGGGGGGGSGTVTSVDVSGGTTGLTTSGGPVTTAGIITIDGTLNAAHGGTGQTALGNLTDSGTDGITVTNGTGATIVNVSIAQHVADSTHNGYLSSTDWNTFNAKQPALTTGNLTDAGTDGITVTGGTGAVIGSGTSIAQHVADATHNGYLSSTDWGTFNGKQAALTIGNLTDAGTDGITVTGGTGSVIGTGTSIAQHVADTTHNGYLSSTDWNTFNGKQASGNYITALTGDVAASGPGSAAATIQAGAVTNSKIANSTIDLTAKVTGVLPVANGGYLTTVYQTTGATAANQTRYLCNTTSAGFTMTLPSGAAGSLIRFVDDAGTWATNNLTIAPAGAQTIQGISGNGSLVCNLSGAFVELAWDATNSYWVVSASGFQYANTGIVVPGTSAGLVSASGLTGATSGSAISAGFVGEYIENHTTSTGLASTGNYVQVATKQLQAGIYLIFGHIAMNLASITGLTSIAAAISLTTNSGTAIGTSDEGLNVLNMSSPAANPRLNVGPVYIDISSPTTYYLNASATFTGGTGMTWTSCILYAVRIA